MGESVKEAVQLFCQDLRKFATGLEESCGTLTKVAESPAYGELRGGGADYFMESLQQQVRSLELELESLDSSTSGTISLHELVGHCSALYKDIEDGTAVLEWQLEKYGYKPVPQPEVQEDTAQAPPYQQAVSAIHKWPEASSSASIMLEASSLNHHGGMVNRPFAVPPKAARSNPEADSKHPNLPQQHIDHPSNHDRKTDHLQLASARLASSSYMEPALPDAGLQTRLTGQTSSASASSSSLLKQRLTGQNAVTATAPSSSLFTSHAMPAHLEGTGYDREFSFNNMQGLMTVEDLGLSEATLAALREVEEASRKITQNAPPDESFTTSTSIVQSRAPTENAGVSREDYGSSTSSGLHMAGTSEVTWTSLAPPLRREAATSNPAATSVSGLPARADVGVSGAAISEASTVHQRSSIIIPGRPLPAVINSSAREVTATTAQAIEHKQTGGENVAALAGAVTAEEYESLIPYLRATISLEALNKAIEAINALVTSKRIGKKGIEDDQQHPCIVTFDQEDMRALGYGTQVKSYLLLLVKLGRIRGEPLDGKVVYRIQQLSD